MSRSSANCSATPANLSKADFDRRSEIISLARYGKITPDEAEAEAAAKGWAPFASEPELPAFDPMRESRWTIVMAVAWIAWRDATHVRQYSLAFSSECTHWFFKEWNEATNDARELVPQAGWWLEAWSEPTTVKLSIHEKWLKSRNELPSTARLSVAAAEQALWEALGDERLVAEALGADGKPVDVPAREWSYLKLFEEGKRDSLKYDALDRTSPYTEVKLKRVDIFRLWPEVAQVQEQHGSRYVESEMIEPIARTGTEGLVPLCAALHWIMTEGGVRQVELNDREGWDRACEKLFSFIESGEIELVGRPSGGALGDKIPGHAVAAIKVLMPLGASISDLLLNAPSHIKCSMYLGRENWLKYFNDQLHLTGRAAAAWTHLQIKKSDVLRRWPRPTPKVSSQHNCLQWLRAEIRKSPHARPKSKEEFSKEAKEKFPALGTRQFRRAWEIAVAEPGATGWSKAGPIPRSDQHTK